MRADEPSETGLSMQVGISVRGDVFSTPLMCPHCDATRLPVSEATAQTDTEDTDTEARSVVLTMLIESMPGRRYLVPSECVPTVFGSSGSTPAR